MSKTLKYLPEGADFNDTHFEQKTVFSQTPKVQRFARGGLVHSSLPVKNQSAGTPSTDPTSPAVKATKQAETDYRRSGGYGFKRGGGVATKCGGGKVKMADGGSVHGFKRTAKEMKRKHFAEGGKVDLPPEMIEAGTRLGQMAGQVIASQLAGGGGGALSMAQPRGNRAGMKAGGGVKKNHLAIGGRPFDAGQPQDKSRTGEPFFGMPKKLPIDLDPLARLAGKYNPHRVTLGLLGLRKNNTPIQDIQQLLAQGKPVTDQMWINANYGPGGMGYWNGTNYPGAAPNVGATGGPPVINMPPDAQEKLEADPVYRRAMGFKSGGSVPKADIAQDKVMVKKAVRQHESNQHPGQGHTKLKLRAGGRAR